MLPTGTDPTDTQHVDPEIVGGLVDEFLEMLGDGEAGKFHDVFNICLNECIHHTTVALHSDR